MGEGSVAIALVGVIGGIIVCLLGLLISMLVGLKTDTETRDGNLDRRIALIQERLSHMVLVEEYKADKKEVTVRMDEHGERILVLEIRVKDLKDLA